MDTGIRERTAFACAPPSLLLRSWEVGDRKTRGAQSLTPPDAVPLQGSRRLDSFDGIR